MWKDQFAKSWNYNLWGEYDIKREEGIYYVFTPKIKKPSICPTSTYVPEKDIDQVEGSFSAKRNNVKKGGGKMTKKAKRRANSTRRR